MAIKDSTAQTLTWLAAIILFTGLMIPAPAGRLFSAIIAGLAIFPPLCFGNPRRRILAGVIALFITLLAYAVFAEYQQDAKQYRQSMKQTSAHQ